MEPLDIIGVSGAGAFICAMMLDFCDFTAASNVMLGISIICAVAVFAVSVIDARRSTRKRKRR